jgi:hypothetical protein
VDSSEGDAAYLLEMYRRFGLYHQGRRKGWMGLGGAEDKCWAFVNGTLNFGVRETSKLQLSRVSVSVAAGTCWPAEQEAGCPPLPPPPTSADHELHGPHRCPNPGGHTARHVAVCSCNPSVTVTSSHSRRNQNCARLSCTYCHCALTNGALFFHSLC